MVIQHVLQEQEEQGALCQWKADQWSSWCQEISCWTYSGTNASACTGNSEGLFCSWVDNYYSQGSCEEPSCWHFDYTNLSQCETYANATYNLTCSWDGQYCNMKGCWDYNAQTGCDAVAGCSWKTSESSGWCEEIGCWSYDSWAGGNNETCIGNSSALDLNCFWEDMPGGTSGTEGWCFTDFDTSCANFTTESECMDTYYCWWEYTDWVNISQGGNCKDPGGDWNTGGGGTFFDDWNPGCYIFDMNETNCNYVVGCAYANGLCDPVDVTGVVTGDDIYTNGLNCTFLNDSQLCNDFSGLGTCCEWKNGTCGNKLGKSCWENADKEQDELGVTACSDVSMQTGDATSAKSLCEQIAGPPLYMPCEWKNSSSTCEFKATQVFGNQTASFALIANQKNCQAAGGKWIKEWYCEGNNSVPAGRCEQKGSNEKNCDMACFACEYKFDGTAHNSSLVAKEYCYDSKLGYCEFVTDTAASNGFGRCEAKTEFKQGVASDCKTNCGSCTYVGNPSAGSYSDTTPAIYDTCNTPQCKCLNAKEFGNVTCKWVSDSSSEIGGYCVGSSEKTCSDACDRCYTRTNCMNDGRGAINASGSCEWVDLSGEITTDETAGTCQKTGETAEVCWDGIDNDGDGLMDCADSGCYSDSFCGFVEGDCFGWTTESTCVVAQLSNGLNCTWVTDPWGSWCDFPGADCWKNDGNETSCNASYGCGWSSGSGSGWCEQDWSVGDDCYSKVTNATCIAVDDCSWTTDTWCDTGDGGTSDWCTTQGGWCDPTAFAPKNCWSSDNTNNATCEGTTGCYWEDPYCMERGCWNYDTNKTKCADESGCYWEESDWQSCEVDWSTDCWKYGNESNTCETNGCAWRTDDWGNWCDHTLSVCWDRSIQTTCEADSSCSWNSNMWNWMTNTQGSCEPACYNRNNETACAITGCRWSDGWCMSSASGGSAGGVDCWQYTNDSTCDTEDSCKWKDPGWCNPEGFGGGAVSGGFGGGSNTGMDCWKYDGNQTLCANSTLINMSCSWMAQDNPFCEPDWSTNCWQYDNSEADCWTNGCYWGGDYCSNVLDQCWVNTSLSTNETFCDANANCNWTNWGYGGQCEPACFDKTTETSCGALSSCRWLSGWCNSPGIYNTFNGMETGAPAQIFMEPGAESGVANHTDIQGIGVKDMGESYGFGSNVWSFGTVGICNQEKLGFGYGNGNKTIKYYVYLDADGVETEGCSPSNNVSLVGYEFFFNYEAIWNASLGKAVEKFTAKKCTASGWAVAEIGLSTWKEKMCSEINGPMIAVGKTDLEKFPSLYVSGQDMRVYVATSDAVHNATYPSDNAGPGWFTPGAIDFPMSGFFEYGTDGAMFEDILKKGFVEYEDCFNSVDDDKDGNIDCADWDCEFVPACSLTVRATDTTMPSITGLKVEEYTDAALIMYYTNKPTNGTVTFWYNDSTCGNNIYNRTIVDATGLATVRNYTLQHKANIYNDAGVSSLDYELANDTSYYYKIQVCDSGDKCSTSACTSFRTAGSRCGYCNFVTMIQTPGGWNVSFDLDINGVYEHEQGDVCGPKAGMKTNYTSGRVAHIKLAKNDGTVYFEFLNVTLSKTGLTSETRTISNATSLIHDTSEGHMGMPAETRDKIINNLHPEICIVKIPSTGTCNALYHCDDSGDDCVDRTAESTLIDATECVWQLPYCEFSTWDEDGNPAPAGDDDSSSGGGGGGGGGLVVGFWNNTYTTSVTTFINGYTQDLGLKEKIGFLVGVDSYYVGIVEFTSQSITVNVSEVVQLILKEGDEAKVDLNSDGTYDVYIKVNSIGDSTANVFVQKTEEIVPEGEEGVFTTGEIGGEDEGIVGEGEGTDFEKNWLIYGSIAVVLIIVLVIVFYYFRKNNRRAKFGY